MISHKGIAIKFLLLVVSVCVFVSGDDAVEVRCIAREREALLNFKDGLIDEYGILSSWGSEECCKWFGVVCSNTTRHVISLQLDAANFEGVLQGQVGSSLLELHHLYYLDLSHNDFGGNPIPEFIGSMKQLQHLSLWESNFYGIVPPQIGNLTNLRSLDLSYNSLRTQNLDWLSTLPLLSFLDLSQIDLSHANWLPHILSLHSLEKLYLASCQIGDVNSSAALFANSSSISPSILDISDNHLTWSSFDWLSNISTSLVLLDLSGNALGGPIPNAFERFNLIEYLNLSNNTLEGEIPESLVNLSHLRILVLYDNDLRGEFDELFGNLTAKGILESLEILDLARNQLSGSVPDLRSFSSLTELYLGANNFTGSMPLSIGQLSNLVILEISHNSLEGLVSESHFMKLDKLKILDLSSNPLISLDIAPDWTPPFQLKWIILAGCNVGPSFPKWIRTQRNFSILDLSRAGIRDEAPRWLWTTSPSLETLLLSDNQISGTIPSLSSTSISYIILINNSISGPIPSFNANADYILLSGNMFTGSISSICKIPHHQLSILDLSNNKLAGEVPNCWENMPKLFHLNLAYNSFSGQIPPSLGSLHDLMALQFRGNNLSGELSSTLTFCQKLRLIDVAENAFTGEIPSWIGEMNQKIAFLNLARNKFGGGIPPQICNLTNIRIVDLSVNNLSGKIPDCFNNFTDMAHKDTPDLTIFGYELKFQYTSSLPNLIDQQFYEYSSIQWKGQESEYKKNLQLLKLIDFSSNKLTGNFPQSFSSLKGLNSLNLSRNSLTGDMIPDIGEMEMLECLDLSNNNLSGRIPTSLAQSQFLSVLDLSNNSFSGKIPTSTQLQSFNASAYAGNDGLCGPPLALCSEHSLRPPTTNPKKNVNERDGGLSFMQEVGISMAFGFIFGFWGIVGSFVLKKSWRIAFFNFFDAVGDWFYVRAAIFLSKWRRN